MPENLLQTFAFCKYIILFDTSSAGVPTDDDFIRLVPIFIEVNSTLPQICNLRYVASVELEAVDVVDNRLLSVIFTICNSPFPVN